MAFDQNQILKDLRPLNIARTVGDETRIAPSASRNVETFFPSPPGLDAGSPGSGTVFYPATVSDGGFVGLGYPNAIAGVASPWCPQVPVAIGPQGTAVGFNYAQNLGNWVAGNAGDQASNDMAAGLVYTPNLNNRAGGSTADQSSNNSATGLGCSPNVRSQVGGNGIDQASEEGGDDSMSGKKVKFLCSFGGKILPRPSDGMLRYVGGQTRIISVRKDVNFSELIQKMTDTCGQPVVIKYQLPDEDLDALVSVSCADDLENMMDEYAKLVERSPDGSAKLRVFLFSASELDSPGAVQFADFQDSGQKYVEAVNGVMDGGVSGGIMRKESITSATSTQNSDFSVTEAMDSSGLAPSDVGCSQSTSVLSPTGNLATPHDTSPRFLGVDPNLANPLSIPIVKTGPLQTSSVETEVERCSPQQPGVGIPSSTHYMHTYVDPRQEVMNRTVLPSQMGFPNAQLFGTGRPVFTQQQFRDNASSVSTQFMPAVHMTMTPPSTLVGMRPTMLQPQQTRLDHYPDERTYGARVFQLPMDQNYNAYQSQVPSAMVGGGYVWSPQIRPPEHVVYSDGLVPHQVMIPEKIPRFEDCYMCQKALPHAHSDTLVQDQRDGVVSPVSDANLVYHSLRLEDNMRAWPINRGMATRAMGEGIVDQGSASLSRVLGQTDHQLGAPQQEAIGFSQNLDGQHENEGIIFQKPNNLDLPRTTAPQGLMNMAGDVQSPYGAFMGGIPQSFQDNAFQRPLMPIQYQVRQEALVNKPINSDVPPPIVVLPTQTSESLVHESPRACSGKLPGAKEDAIEGRMETLQIRPTDILVTNEQSKSRIDELRKEDIINRPQQAAGREGLLDTAFSKPQTILDTNHSKPMEKPLPSHTEVPHVHNLLPVESFKVVEPPSIGNLGPCSPSRTGICHLDPVETRGNVVVSGVESTYGMDKIPPVSEWRDDTSSFQPKLVLGDVETFPLNSNMPSSSSSPSSRAGDAQDFSNSLFSNQDPWNMRQEKHFLPPRPNKIATNKETFYTPFGDNNLVNGGELLADMLLEDRAHQPSGNSDKDCNSDHVRSIKAEELIKQELQATAEGVAASIFQTATPSNSDLSAVTGNESASETNRDSGVSSSIDMQHTANVEDIKTKVPEKINTGFPVSDGLGRLQIIKNSDLEELQELGSGTFGTVYHGKWRGTDVAIKRINDRCFAGKPSEQERMRDDFWNEAIKLADLHHPNVVAFYGVVLDGPGGSVATVTEYMVNGSLRNALQRNERNLDKRKRLLIAMDVAFGMEYLHGKNIVHFDLKSDNLLVNLRDPHRPICKVGDLGLSKVKCQTLISGGVRGTLPWMAPELLNGSSSLVSEKVDVFSFGIVLWELLTGEEPYADLHYGAIIGGIVSNTLRPPIPESCDPEWRLLMERCWASEPAERPNFTEIADELRSMAAKLPLKGQAQQQQVSSAQK